ncbi:mechanosensitive ion channel family protein [Massilia sp. PWRC2]|uniref:mechanosensitive ion channel family protein n=1 Tax=Massilia sp. PWRC2 TaxID=2804626 RepID=UPI003CF4B783
MQQLTNWSDALIASLTGAASMFFVAVPRLIGFAIILIVGWMIASLIEKAVVTALRAVRFNVLAERAGLVGFIQKSNMQHDAASAIGIVSKWFVRLMVLVVAFDALGLPAVSAILHQLLMWLPNLVVALVVLVIGGIAANTVSKLVLGSAAEGGLDRPALLARVARVAVWTFAIMVAINQVGIGTSLINILLMAAAGAVALALGLSFGLGGRDTAAGLLRKWYEQGTANAGQLRRAGDDATGDIDLLRRQAGIERRSLSADRRGGSVMK